MLLCGSGFYIAWRISLQSIHNSQRTVILNSTFNQNKVVSFVFSKKDFQTNTDFSFDGDDENEFEFKGQMYDIINQKNFGDSIYISCISDNEEDNLRDFAMAQILNNNNNTSEKKLPILNFRLDHFTNNFETINNLFLIQQQKVPTYKRHNSGSLPITYLSTSSPPPWCFS